MNKERELLEGKAIYTHRFDQRGKYMEHIIFTRLCIRF